LSPKDLTKELTVKGKSTPAVLE